MKPEPLKIELTPEAYEDLKRIAKKIKEIDEFKKIDEKVIIRLLAVTFVTFKLREKSAVEWLLKEIEKETNKYLDVYSHPDDEALRIVLENFSIKVKDLIKKAFEGVIE